MPTGKILNYRSEQDHQQKRYTRLYGIFSKNVFSFWIIFRNGKKNVSLLLLEQRKVLSFFFPGGYSCNTRFFYIWKERFSGLWQAPEAW
jgi:hypothetical protein